MPGLHCCGFSCGAQALGHTGFSSCGAWLSGCCSRALAHRLHIVVHLASCSTACGIVPTRDRTRVSCIGRQILYHWASGEALSFSREVFFFPLHFSMIIFWIQNSRLVVFLGFSFNTLNILHHSLAHMVSEKNFDVFFYPGSSISNVFSPFGFQLFSLPLISVVWIYYT